MIGPHRTVLSEEKRSATLFLSCVFFQQVRSSMEKSAQAFSTVASRSGVPVCRFQFVWRLLRRHVRSAAFKQNGAWHRQLHFVKEGVRHRRSLACTLKLVMPGLRAVDDRLSAKYNIWLSWKHMAPCTGRENGFIQDRATLVYAGNGELPAEYQDRGPVSSYSCRAVVPSYITCSIWLL